MVTYFNRKDLVSFGSYLLSEERKALYESASRNALKDGIDIAPTDERLECVSHADIENWIQSQGK
jgi:hypothetical protein